MLLPDIDSFQAAVHHDKLEYTLLVSMLYMHMYWLMFIGVEVEYKSEVFVYFRHVVVIVFTMQRYTKLLVWQNKCCQAEKKNKYSPQNMRRTIAKFIVKDRPN